MSSTVKFSNKNKKECIFLTHNGKNIDKNCPSHVYFTSERTIDTDSLIWRKDTEMPN